MELFDFVVIMLVATQSQSGDLQPLPGQIISHEDNCKSNPASVLSVVSSSRKVPAVTAARRPVLLPSPAGEERSATDLSVTGGESAGAGNDRNVGQF